MPAKIPKPSFPIHTDSNGNGLLHFGKQLFETKTESLQTQKTQMTANNDEKTSNDVQKHLKTYLLAVAKTGCSSSTIRNYRSDINQFLDFADSDDLNDLRNKPKLLAFAHYQREKGLKENSIKRKLISITQFKIWLKQQGLINSEIPLAHLDNNAESESSSQKNELLARKIIDQEPRKEPKKIETLEVKKAKKNQKPQSRVFLLLNLLALFLFLGGLAYFAYQQFGQAIISLAYPSTPTAPNRILSYQGRLTNTAQSPISEPTAMTYTLYDDATGGSILWASNTCTIDPDQDGIFNANLGAGAGTGADNENCGGSIDEDVFTENNNVWLEVAVGAETLLPRQPIRTVAYALNAATLQGLPPSEVATNSTILMMNSAGELVLGTDNPVIKTAVSSSGMTIEANRITIQTTAGSNGDIILAPDGDGILDIQSDASVSGNTTLIGNVDLTSPNNLIFGGTTALGEISSPTDSGAFLIGVNDQFTNSNSTNVQGVLADLDTAIGIAGNPTWSNLIDPEADLALDHDTFTTAFNWATGTGTDDLFSLTTDASSNGTGSLLNLQTGTSSTVSPLRVRAGSTEALAVNSSGNVGIGTTNPGSKLVVAGGDVTLGYSGEGLDRTLWIYGSGSAGAANQYIKTVGSGALWHSGYGGFTMEPAGNLSIKPWNAIDAGYIEQARFGGSGGLVIGRHYIGGTAPSQGLIVEGNVGIGTLAPSSRLHIVTDSGEGNPTYDGWNSLILQNNALNTDWNSTTIIAGSAGSSVLEFGDKDDANAGFIRYDHSNNKLSFATNSIGPTSSNMVIDSAGNVGIGTTSPSEKLDVTGNVRFSGALMPNNAAGTSGQFLISGGAGAAPTWTSTVGATSVPFSGITSGTNTTAAMVVGAGASLNYTSTGTINASSLLGGTWAIPGAIGSTTANTGAFTTLSSTGNTTFGDAAGDTVTANAAAWTFANDTNFTLTGGTNGLSFDTNTLSIDAANDRVGIGTNTPSDKLHVAGDLRLTGAFKDAANSAGTSGYILSSTGTGTAWIDASTLSAGSDIWSLLSTHNITPTNSSYNLLLGGDSSASAKISMQGTTGNIYTKGNLNLSGSDTDRYISLDVTNTNQGALIFESTHTGTAGSAMISTVENGSYERKGLGFFTKDTADWTTGATEKMRLTSGGNLGIGTINPTSRLYVQDDGTYTANESLFSVAYSPSSGGTRNLQITSPSTDDSNAPFNFQTYNAFNFQVDGVDGLTINYAGNVGLGTTTPIGRFQIQQNTLNSPALFIGRYDNEDAALFKVTEDDTWGVAGVLGGAELATSNRNMVFSTDNGNTASLFIQSTGNVGIGVTDPTSVLQIGGSSSTIVNDSGDITIDSASNNISLAGDNLINVGNGLFAGNLGIGTNTPIFQTEIFGNGQLTANLTDAGNRTGMLAINGNSTSAGAGGAIVFGNSSSHTANSLGFAAIKGLLSNSAGNTIGDLAFSTRATTAATSLTERMRITAGGFVGIGTDNPNEMLMVNGSINAEKYYDLTNKNYYLDPASVGTSLKLAGNAEIAGNLGLGTTSSAYKLSIGGATSTIANTTGDITINAASNNISFAGDNLINIGTGNFVNGYFSGVVGIGTTSPVGKLGVVGANFADPSLTADTNQITNFQAGSIQLASGVITASPWTYWFQTKNSGNTGVSYPLALNPLGGNVGIGTTNPRGVLNLRGYTGGTVGSAVAAFNENFVIGGAYNQAYNSGNAVLLHISDYSNDAGDNVYPIYVEDENNNVAFYLNGGVAGGAGTAYFGGNVGIGVTSPQKSLHIDKSGVNDIIIRSQASNAAANTTLEALGIYNISFGASSNSFYQYYTDSSNVARYIATAGTAIDLAEWYKVGSASLDGSGNSKLKKGQLLCIDNSATEKVVACSAENNQLIGIVSTQSYQTMGMNDLDDDHHDAAEVALTGRVPLITTIKNGQQIKSGDHLTTSNLTGVSSKATQAGDTVAKALDNTNWSTQSCPAVSSLDAINWPNDDGTNKQKPCFTLPDGSIVGKIMAFVNVSWYDPSNYLQIADLTLDSNGNVVITGNSEETYAIATSTSAIDRIAAFADVFTARLQAGFIKTKELVADALTATNATIANLTAPKIETDTITSSDGQIDIVSNATVSGDLAVTGDLDIVGDTNINNNLSVAGESKLGQLIADTATISEATITGTLSAGEVKTDELEANSARINAIETQLAQIENATVSGTLYAENIEANSISANVISGLKERLSEQIAETLTQPTLLATLFAEQTAQTDEYLGQLSQEINGDATASATTDATLEDLDANISDSTFIADNAFINEYFEVNGNAFIANSLKIGQSLILGENTAYGTDYISYQPTDTEDFTFHIQPSGMGRLSLMAGLMLLDQQGFVTINGDLKVAGVLEVEDDLKVKGTLLTNMIGAETPGENIQVQLASVQQGTDSATIAKSNFEFVDETRTPVATVSAGGDLSLTGSLRINNPATASEASALTNSSSAGQATLEAGATEITIASDKVEENSMIYVTPLNSTNNQVLYVKNKITDSSFTPENDGQFTVAIDYALGHNVVFNWWIIQLN